MSEVAAPTAAARPHPLRQPRLLLALGLVLLAVNLPFLHAFLGGDAEVTAAVPYKDAFDRATVGDAWWSNGGHWRIVDGQLYSPGVVNNPLWLKARLPADARIQFDVRSEGRDGDIKCELYGDGRNHASGYLMLFGAWSNRESRLAKLDEHAFTRDELRAQLAQLARPYPQQLDGLEALFEAIRGPLARSSAKRDLERLEKGTYFRTDTPFVVKRADAKVARGRTYHVTLTKKGGTLRWENDGQLVLEMQDPAPLSGSGHDRFGFSSWQNDTYFDNLVIEGIP